MGLTRARDTAAAVPAARSEGLLVQSVGEETVIYDREAKAAHCLKPLAAIVFGHSDGRTTVRELAKISTERLGETVGETDVADAVSQLDAFGLLQTVAIVSAGDDRPESDANVVSRREMMRRVGFAGAATVAATSLVTSVAPSTALAASGIPTGCTGCGKNSDCILKHCCQDSPSKTCNQ